MKAIKTTSTTSSNSGIRSYLTNTTGLLLSYCCRKFQRCAYLTLLILLKKCAIVCIHILHQYNYLPTYTQPTNQIYAVLILLLLLLFIAAQVQQYLLLVLILLLLLSFSLYRTIYSSIRSFSVERVSFKLC